MRVGVVTDSAANLPVELVTEFGIGVVPMILRFGDRIMRDGVDRFEGGSFYAELEQRKESVSTAAPSMGDFAQAYDEALRAADAVVCVTVASFVSATYETAFNAAAAYDDRVRVVDSRSASLGEGFAALEAARAASAGTDLDAVLARAQDVAARTTLIGTIETFEYLRRSGRVNAVMAYAATALDIKPVFGFRGGALEQLGRPRTRARALDRLVAAALTEAATGPLHIGIAHADRRDEAEALLVRLTGEVPTVEAIVSEFTPLMGAHTGPGVMTLSFWAERAAADPSP